MSDGNFNRALLPHTPYASGLKMGQAMARTKAEQAFQEWLQTDQPDLSPELRQEKIAAFKQLLARL